MAYCGHCGVEYTPKLTQAFCVNCGSRLEEPSQAPDATMLLTRVPRLAGRLVAKGGREPGRTFELKRDRVTMGAAAGSGVLLEHSSVSPYHAVIRVSQGRFVLYDAGSENGTWVNGEPQTGELLAYGARISVGATEILFTAAKAGQDSGSRGALVVRSGPSDGQRFPIEDRDVVIGRRPGEGGLQLSDRTVSQRHALVHPTAHGCMIYDLGSNNGTMIDGVPLKGRPLHDGDVIKLGDVELQFVARGHLVSRVVSSLHNPLRLLQRVRGSTGLS